MLYKVNYFKNVDVWRMKLPPTALKQTHMLFIFVLCSRTKNPQTSLDNKNDDKLYDRTIYKSNVCSTVKYPFR